MRVYVDEPLYLYLYEDQADALEALAEQRGLPAAELVRQAVDALLANAPENVAELARHWQRPQPWPEDRPIEEDPLWGIVGLADAEVAAVAENHGRYTSETTRNENQPCPDPSS